MKALITGAGGFIGSFLMNAWIQKGYAARALFLPGEDVSEAKELGVQIVYGDLTQPETLSGICRDMDMVFHLAARVSDWGSKAAFERIMVDGTRNLLQEAAKAKVKRFVYFSSIAALGFGRDMKGLDEDAERKPCGIPYSDTKIAAEDLVSDFCSRQRMNYTIIRPANVTGPRSVWVTDILDAYGRGPLPLVAGGKMPGSFVYITNLIDGALLAAESEKAVNRTYHFRDDFPMNWKYYLETLGSWVGKKPMGSIPFFAAWNLGRVMEMALTPLGVRPPMTRLAAGVMGKNNDVDNSRARTELGWRSRVDQDTAMAEIEKWVKENYLKSG